MSTSLLDQLRLFQESPPHPSQLVEVVTLQNGTPLGQYVWVTVVDMGTLLVQRLPRISAYGIARLLAEGTIHADSDTYPATLKDADGNRYNAVLRNINLPE